MSLAPPVFGSLGGMIAASGRLNRGAKRKRWVETVQSYKKGRAGGSGITSKSGMAASTRFRLRRRKRPRRSFRRRSQRLSFQWPRFKLVKFKVVSPISRTTATGAVEVYTFGANTLADPHGSLTGNNLPLGLDQWAAMYSKYVVVGSTHYVKLHNVSSTGSVTYGLTLRKPGEYGALADCAAFLEQPMTVSKLLSPDQDHSGLGISFKAKKYFSVKKFMDAEQLHATFSTTPGAPTRTAYVTFWYGDTNGTDVATIEGWATSEYTCLLFDPITPARSAI